MTTAATTFIWLKNNLNDQSFRGESDRNQWTTVVYLVEIGIRRRSRERRSPVSEIVTDTPTICQRDTGQRGRSAMDTPRHEGTPYLIEVTSRPGKYELIHLNLIQKLNFEGIFMAREEKEAEERRDFLKDDESSMEDD